MKNINTYRLVLNPNHSDRTNAMLQPCGEAEVIGVCHYSTPVTAQPFVVARLGGRVILLGEECDGGMVIAHGGGEGLGGWDSAREKAAEKAANGVETIRGGWGMRTMSRAELAENGVQKGLLVESAK